MSTRKMPGRGEVVTVAGARDVEGVNTTTTITTITVEIMWELPLQTMQLIMSSQLWPSSLLDHECQMAQEDLQWVGGSHLLWILHNNWAFYIILITGVFLCLRSVCLGGKLSFRVVLMAWFYKGCQSRVVWVKLAV